MDENTQTATTGGMGDAAAQAAVQAPVLPTGQQIYDAFMAVIEPELVSTVIDTLDAKYAGETPEQKAERMSRYERAFDEYDKQYTEYMAKLAQYVHEYRRTSIKQMEGDNRSQEQGVDMQQLESAIQTQ